MKHILFLTVLLPVSVLAASLPELPTIIYGSVHNQCGGRDVLVTHGELTWTIRDGNKTHTVSGKLGNLVNGQYSYRMRIPHEVKIEDRVVSPETIPISDNTRLCEFINPTVDGQPVHIVDPDKVLVVFSSWKRPSAVRIDLRVDMPMPDSDGDSLADWWESAFGLDPDSPDDALVDEDGDGWSNADEFAFGGAPGRDNRIPALTTTTFVVYPDARNGLWLDVLDSDSTVEGIECTLEEKPDEAVVSLGSETWECDDPIALSELRNANLFFQGQGMASIELTLKDESHTGVAETIMLRPYAGFTPGDSPESMRGILDLCQGRSWGAQVGASLVTGDVWDFSRRGSGFVADTTLGGWIIGSSFDDRLTGSEQGDVLWGMAGSDVLTGGSGGDVFVADGLAGESDTITDFDISEDVLDLRSALQNHDVPLDDLLALSLTPSGTTVRVAAGSELRFTIVLDGVTEFGTLGEALTAGRLLVPDLLMPSCVQVAALAGASETGQLAGRVRLWRTGAVSEALTVSLTVAGSASPGGDYQRLPEAVTFLAGERERIMQIVPFRDLLVEGEERVTVSIAASNRYRRGTETAAEVCIFDLREVVELEVAEPIANRETGRTALVFIKRSGQIGRPGLVQLRYSGTVVNGVHIDRLPSYVQFGENETRQPLEIFPAAGVDPGDGLSLLIDIVGDDDIVLGPESSGEVFVCAQEEAAANWLKLTAAEQADADGDGLTRTEEQSLGSDPARPTVVLNEGWNLISVPVFPEEGATLADQLGQENAELIEPVWKWNGMQYVAHHGALVPGNGYFAYALQAGFADIDGPIAKELEVSREAGWNLLGMRRRLPARQVPGEWRGFTFVEGGYRGIGDTGINVCQGFWLYHDGQQ